MEQIYTPKQDYKVLVTCMTYNQSKFIEDALNGFAMQQTKFPFVCLVVDDSSTDGEQELIKTWMEHECDMEKAEYTEIELSHVILVPHMSNANCIFAFYLLKQNLYGTGKKLPLITPWRNHCEYEAMCEGDDYWIHTDKLQIQADYLDGHNNIHFVFTNRKILKNGVFTDSVSEKAVYVKKNILNGFIPGVQTMMLRLNKLDNDALEKYGKYVNGDILYSYLFSLEGPIVCMPYITAVYRSSGEGVCSSLDKIGQFRTSIKHYYNFHKVFGFPYNRGLYKLEAWFLMNYCWGDMLHFDFSTYIEGLQYVKDTIGTKRTFCVFCRSIVEIFIRVIEILKYKCK